MKIGHNLGKVKTQRFETLEEDFKKVHGNRYNYEQAIYKGVTTNIKIVCSKHGAFWQRPSKHLWGQGCPKCVGKYLNTMDFIQKAFQVFGEEYDYSLTKYINSKTKLEIGCNKHGSFWQLPSNHLKGQGCPKCCTRGRKDFNYYVEKFNIIHNNKYSYPKQAFKYAILTFAYFNMQF